MLPPEHAGPVDKALPMPRGVAKRADARGEEAKDRPFHWGGTRVLVFGFEKRPEFLFSFPASGWGERLRRGRGGRRGETGRKGEERGRGMKGGGAGVREETEDALGVAH